MTTIKKWIYPTLLALLALLLNLSIVGNDFVYWDDPLVYTENTNLHKNWKNFSDIKWIFDLETSMRFAPTSWIAYKTIYEMSGMDPIGIRISSLTLHTLNTLLVFFVASQFLVLSKVINPRGWAFILTTLWVTNPLRVEPVAWATALTYLISTFFCLSSLLVVLKNKHNKLCNDIVASILLTLSITSYPIAYMVPLTIPFWLYIRNKETNNTFMWNNLLPFIPPLLLAVTLSLWTTFKRLFSTSLFYTPIDNYQIDLISKFETIVARLLYFTSTCVIPPVEITPAHYAGEALWLWTQVLGAILLLSLLVVCCNKWRTIGLLGLVPVIIVISIPVLGITEDPMLPVDRYSYLLSFFILLCLILALTTIKWRLKFTIVFFFMTYIIGATYIQQTSQSKWRNSVTLLNVAYQTKVVQDSEYLRAIIKKNLAFHHANILEYNKALYILEGIESPTLANSNSLVARYRETLIQIALYKSLGGCQSSESFLQTLIERGIIQILPQPHQSNRQEL